MTTRTLTDPITVPDGTFSAHVVLPPVGLGPASSSCTSCSG